MPIVRSGYATHTRNGSTRAYRQARANAIANATHCAICHQPLTPGDPIDAHHTNAYADHGHGQLAPTHAHCNRSLGRSNGGGILT